MSKYIKNISGATKTYQGKDIFDTEYRVIADADELKWMNDSSLLSDIGNGVVLVAKDDSGSNDITDVNSAINYLKDLKTEIEVDLEGRQVSRQAFGNKGWAYLAHPIEFTTATKDSCFSEDWKGDNRSDFTCKFYNSSGVELVADTQAELDTDCVETRVTLALDYDYELISGKIEQHISPSVDIRMWVIGGVINTTTNEPFEYPGAGDYLTKEFAGGINLKFIGADQEIETDGRASKFMCKDKGLPYAANQIQIIMKHPVGHKHDLMMILEYFRA